MLIYEQLALIPLCLQDQQEGCFEALDMQRRLSATLHRRQGESTSLKAELKARLQLLWQSTRQPRHVQGDRGMEGLSKTTLFQRGSCQKEDAPISHQ